MNNEPFERAMDSLRESRAKLEAIHERMKAQLKEMTEGSDTLTDSQADKIGEEGRDGKE